MVQNLEEAFHFFAARRGIVTAIVLVVWLPGNILMELVIWGCGWSENLLRQFQVASAFGAVLDPLVLAAITYVVAQSKAGQECRFRAAMSCGWRCWGSVFGTRLLAGLCVLGGLILLIVPGIVLALRWTLIDPVVVLEGIEAGDARRRSSELTRGRRLQIFGALVLLFVGTLLLSIVLNVVPVFIVLLDNFIYYLITSCATDLFRAVSSIVLTLYFLEAIERENRGGTEDEVRAADGPDLAYEAPWPPQP